MSKFKVGDRVRIVNHRNAHWNLDGEMDKWQGKIMTIRELLPDNNYHMEEDRGEHPFGEGWYWEASDFAELMGGRGMKDLITEARELIEALHAGEYDDEYIGTGAYLMLDELCGATEESQEQNKQLMHEVCKLACESLERDRALARLEAEVMVWAKAEQEGRLVVLPCKERAEISSPPQ